MKCEAEETRGCGSLLKASVGFVQMQAVMHLKKGPSV